MPTTTIDESEILVEGTGVVNSAGLSIKDRKKWKGFKVRYFILKTDNMDKGDHAQGE